ncbi:hypothetical protein Pcinc_007208 [Petrolisthes cinctipes]|uniref:Reverse transcriptase domain-containing protein n=1 Tax=Petrolisthes cinctipes TaxID=88211 RepID=A0AAE1G8X3_PETCI|nr:hypothetical protein Pcinc_007208 [Petrolisthes cinctipes]
MDDIVNAIKEIGTNAAASPDQFQAALLKNCAKELRAPLHILFRNSIDTGIIPQQLKTAKIIPVYKGGSKGEAKNYRPIALTSHIIKIMEKIIVRNMSIYLEEKNILNNYQHGFRVGRSCLSQLLSHHEKIINGLENKKNIDAIYLDFAKAFDKVDHGILLHKLRDFGISGKLGKWLHCFLVNRQQSVAVSGVVSKPSIVTSGVPQGTTDRAITVLPSRPGRSTHTIGVGPSLWDSGSDHWRRQQVSSCWQRHHEDSVKQGWLAQNSLKQWWLIDDSLKQWWLINDSLK